jgi:chromosome segregation and condensation protein ScpB
MRKVRDFDAELKALADKQRALKAKRIQQLGELVLATGAEGLSIEQLAGALLEAVEAKADAKEAWRGRGVDFFRKRTKAGGGGARDQSQSEASELFAQPSASQTRSWRSARLGRETARANSPPD